MCQKKAAVFSQAMGMTARMDRKAPTRSSLTDLDFESDKFGLFVQNSTLVGPSNLREMLDKLKTLECQPGSETEVDLLKGQIKRYKKSNVVVEPFLVFLRESYFGTRDSNEILQQLELEYSDFDSLATDT